MEISEQLKFKDVIDYDFMFVGGEKLTFPVEFDAGDVVEELADRFVINLSSKPSLIDEKEKSDPSTIQVFKVGLAAHVTTARKVRMPSEEELFNMRKTFKTFLPEPRLTQ